MRLLAKPWSPSGLLETVRHHLIEFVLEADLDPLPHLRALDGPRVMDIVRRRLDR